MRKTIAIVLLAVLICSMSVSALSFTKLAKRDTPSPALSANLVQKVFSARFAKVTAPRVNVPPLKCVQQVGPETFEAEVLQNDGPVVVDFWAPWCGYCRLLKPIYEQLCTEYKGRLKFVAFNTDLDEGVWARYGMTGIPTMIFFNDGREVYRHVGYSAIDRLRGVMNSVLRSL